MKNRLDSLEAVRAAACIGILSYHMYLTYLGAWGVTLFFVLSAFLMSYNYLDRPVFEKPSFKEGILFSLRKTSKLYPLHLLTLAVPLLLQVFAIVTGRMEFEGAFVGKAIVNILLLHSLCPPQSWYFSFNAVSWFLSSIMIIYLFVPLILRRIRKYRGKLEAWVAVGITILCQPLLVLVFSRLVSQAGFCIWLGYICPFIRLGDYIIGCNLAYLFLHRREKTACAKQATILELSAIALNIAAQYLVSHALLPSWIKNSTAFIPGAALLVWCFACGDGYLSRALTGRAAHFVSSLSSFVFLIHPVVIQLSSIVLERVPIPYQLKRWCFLFIVPIVSFALANLYRKYSKGFFLKHHHIKGAAQ